MKKVLMLAPMPSVHERFNKVNIKVLTEMKCEIHIAANFNFLGKERIQRDKIGNEDAFPGDVTLHNIGFRRGSLLKNLRALKECRALLSLEKFDAVHAHTETGGLLLRLLLPRKSPVRRLYTPHGVSFYEGSSLKSRLIYRPIEKWICGGMHAIIAVNTEEYRQFKAWNPKTAKYVHGIGVDTDTARLSKTDADEKRTELHIPSGAFLILSVGELNKNKNHETVIRAIAEMKARNVYYLICGEGPLKNHLKEVSRALGVSERVILAGYRRDIARLMDAADLFVFPSFHEGLPVSLMEAMTAGLPVVCSKIRGNTDLIDDGRGGILCEPKDERAFKTAIEILRDNADARERMKQINLNRVGQFSASAVSRELRQIYEEVIFFDKSQNQYHRTGLQ